jgi:hypothetical protein
MSFMLPHAPSPEAGVQELADFAELRAWDSGNVSAREIVAALNQVDDNDSNVGCEDDEVQNTDTLTDVFRELDRRASTCGAAYPFAVQSGGEVLQHFVIDAANAGQVVYRYLLLGTRLNMLKHRVHATHDGTFLFEEFSAAALKTYLGNDRAQSLVFGTSVGGGFGEKVKVLCNQTREGGTHRSVDESGLTANDGKLDAIAWIPFADKREGQAIIFSQCKTGTTWKNLVTQCRPLDFSIKWFERAFAVEPVRAFCVAESLDKSNWFSLCVDAGLVFDRCRLVEFSHGVKGELLQRLLDWTIAAKKLARTDNLKHRSPTRRRKSRATGRDKSKPR